MLNTISLELLALQERKWRCHLALWTVTGRSSSQMLNKSRFWLSIDTYTCLHRKNAEVPLPWLEWTCFMQKLLNLICTSIGISIMTHVHVSITQRRLKLDGSSNGSHIWLLPWCKTAGTVFTFSNTWPIHLTKEKSRRGIILDKICYDSYAWAFILDHLTCGVVYNKHLILTSLIKTGPVERGL